MLEQALGGVGVVRRRDHRDRVGADLRGMRGQRRRLLRRDGARVDGEVEPAGRRRAERLGEVAPLALVEQDPLAGRAEREDAVDTAPGEVVDVPVDRVEVDGVPAVAQRAQRGGEDAPEH
jgi:hypothetical protein